jgi:hypothetical protein
VKEFAVYTVARIGLFLATFAVVAGVWLLANGGHGVPLLWPFFIAVVVSAIGSYYLLKKPRERFARMVDRRASAAARRFEQARSKEDSDD